MNEFVTRHIIILIMLLLPGSVVTAQGTLEAAAPNVVKQGQQFQLTFTANDDISNFQFPEVDGLSILGGPSQSTSTSIRVINGKTQQNKTVSHTYYVRFDQPGNYTIPAAKARVGGDAVQSNSLQVEVIKQGQSAAQGSGSRQDGADGNPELFIRLVPSKNSAYVGEPITIDLKIYTKVNITDIGRSYKEADFNGFFKEELETPPLNKLEAENYNGEVYYTGVVKRFLVFPTKAGNLRINPFELEVQVQKRGQRRSRSPFDDFFGSAFNATWINYISDPITIRAQSLPDNQPASFSGAVGNYSLKASLQGEEITTNDAVSLKLTVSGNGNLKLIDEIDVDLPPTFEKLEPQISTNVKNTTKGYQGSKTFTYTFIPRSAGTFTIPPIKFTYFDISARRYRTHTTRSYEINVSKGEQSESLTVVTGVSKEDVKYIGQDIRFIKTSEPSFVHINSFIINKKWFPLTFIFVFVIFLLIFLVFIKKEKESKNAVLAKNKKANKLARKKLRAAKKHLSKQDNELFYAEMLKALWGYMSDKLMIPVAELSRDKARESMHKYAIPDELIEAFIHLTEQCEYARYAPASGDEDMHNTYKKAVKTIVSIENKIK
jgi:hypothetical protein